MKKLFIITTVLLSFWVTTSGQICQSYGEGICFIKSEGETVTCRTPKNAFEFRIIEKKNNEYNVSSVDPETGEITDHNYSIRVFGKCDSTKLILPNKNILYTYYSEKLNPFARKTFINKIEYTIRNHYEGTLELYEIMLNGVMRISNEKLETLDQFQITKNDLNQLEILAQNINVGTLNNCNKIYWRSHSNYYSFNFISYDLKQNSINYQRTPFLLRKLETHIKNIIKNR